MARWMPGRTVDLSMGLWWWVRVSPYHKVHRAVPENRTQFLTQCGRWFYRTDVEAARPDVDYQSIPARCERCRW